MYIPRTSNLEPDFALAPTAGVGGGPTSAYELTRDRIFPFSVESISFLARWTFSRGRHACSAALGRAASSLRKRTSPDSVNTTIGVVVGVLLAVFLVGFFAFLYFYGRSIRVTRRRHRRRKSSGSKGSKNSDGAGSEPPAPAPAPA